MPTWADIVKTIDILLKEQKALANLVQDDHDTCQDINKRIVHLEYVREALDQIRGEAVGK